MKRYTFLLLFILSCSLLNAQATPLDSLRNELAKAKNDTTKCNLLIVIAETLYESKPDTVIPLSEKTIELVDKALKKANAAEKTALLKAKASALNNIGIIKGEQGDISTAIQYYLKSLDAHIENHYKIGMASAFHNLGYTYDNSGDVPMALEYYHKALKIQEEINDKSEIAMSLNDIGYLYTNQGEITKALEYYNKSLKYRKETGDKRGESQSLNNIGNIYDKHGNPACVEEKKECLRKGKEIALGYYEKSLKIQTEIQDKRGMAYSLNNIAIIYKDIDDSTVKAMEYFEQSLKLHNEVGNRVGGAYAINNISNLFLKQGNIKAALSAANNSMDIAKEVGQPELILRNASTLKNIYRQLNKFEDAFKMYELEITMRDSLKSQNNRKAALQKQFQYIYEKKAAEDSVKIFEEKKVTMAQLKQEKTQRFALYGGLLLVGLFGAFMFNRFKVTKKQNHLIQEQKTELQRQKELVEEHQKETLDSIHYAKRIQTALITNADVISETIPDNFILFQPKDIVSGDFYWATTYNDKFYLAVCDSTGHGVPGAFMSLLNMGFLSEAIKEKHIEKPHEIFNYVRQRLISTISDGGQKDGMDGILICIDTSLSSGSGLQTITYAAANNEPVLIRDNEITELPKDKMPVGKGERTESFSLHSIELKQGDALYLYTDGFADQFGGPKGKKFKYKKLNDILLGFNSTPIEKQKVQLESEFSSWKGTLEQVDDVLVIGIKF
ncbi:MAG: protein serine/threonine phosphatase [Bacteroidota bacterium]|jgi:serine phosphatase RsbU (regulator of sigma subunit)|nr:protein serine/threonine phosphatase [Bacteroidota bacterium]